MTKKKNHAFEFLTRTLKKNGNAVYADVAKAAAKRGLTVYPVMFGRAKLLLGLVKAGEGRTKTAQRPAKARRVVRVTGIAGSDVADGIVAMVRGANAERVKLRGALEKIQGVLREALA